MDVLDRLTDDTRRTVGCLIGAMLGLLPLCTLFLTQPWLLTAWFVMVVTIVPAAALRLWQPTRLWHLAPGILIGLEWLVIRYLPDHLIAGFIPTGATVTDLNHLVTTLRDAVTNDTAPVAPTAASTFAVGLLAIAIAVIVDLLAVQARHAALAGLPLLVVFLTCGTVVRGSVHWLLFILAAVGFMLILAVDARSELAQWGPVIGRPGDLPKARLTPQSSAQRIGAMALVAALVLALVAPLHAGNWLANALRTNGSGDGSGGGNGNGVGLSIAPFAALKGQLTRPKPTVLMKIKLSGPGAQAAYYQRAGVLTDYTGTGWQAGSKPDTVKAQAPFQTTLPSGGGSRAQFTAQITPLVSGDVAPVFAVPTRLQHLSSSAKWTPDHQTVTGSVKKNKTFTEGVNQPYPSAAQLRAANAGDAAPQWTQLPGGIPSLVKDLTTSIVKGQSSEYDKARAITNYFLDPGNGFSYSLRTAAGDSGNELVDFLRSKVGFCQQYAAAATVMMRLAGLPARVAIGYTHGIADPDGTVTVTTSNAHAWTEVYFAGLGWVPFDATPQGGAPGASTASLPWLAPDSGSGNSGQAGSSGPSASRASSVPHRGQEADSSGPAPVVPKAVAAKSESPWLVWLLAGLGVIAVVALAVPAFTRVLRRRRRLARARHGETEALWAELSATATDLGYVWSDARTPRQVARWLESTSGTDAARSLAEAVESDRYARPGAGPSVTGTVPSATAVKDLRRVEAGLRDGRSITRRLRARLLPPSLGWSLLQRGRRSR